MLLPVAPVDHTIVPVHPVAVSVAFSPSHTIVLSVWMDGVAGPSEIPIVTGTEMSEVPQWVVQVAVKVPAYPIWMLAPVAPVDQVTVPAQPAAVSVAFSPAHINALSVLTDGTSGLSEVFIITGTDFSDVPQVVAQVAV